MANQYDSIGKHFEAKAVSHGEFEALKRFPEYETLTDGTLMRIEGSKEFRIYPENVVEGFPFQRDDARLVEGAPGILQAQNAANGESRFRSSGRSGRVIRHAPSFARTARRQVARCQAGRGSVQPRAPERGRVLRERKRELIWAGFPLFRSKRTRPARQQRPLPPHPPGYPQHLLSRLNSNR